MWKPHQKPPSLTRNLKNWALGAFAVLAMFAAVLVFDGLHEVDGSAAQPEQGNSQQAEHAAAVDAMVAEHGADCWGGPTPMPADMEGQFPGAAIVDHKVKVDGKVEVEVDYVTNMALIGAALDFAMKGAEYPGLVEVYRFCR